jgi:hypothetical protein
MATKIKLGYDAPKSQEDREPFHFFASSVAEWRTSENLDELIATMKKLEYPFNLFFVPIAATAEYEIRQYSPRVEGTKFLGFWDRL